jgi:DNA-binding XRE family transcriptional regulator
VIAEQFAGPMTHEERVKAFRDGINQLRSVAHQFIDAELFGALDEVTRLVQTLEKKYALFVTMQDVELPVPVSGHKGRRIGIDIIPGSVKLARTEARLSLRQVAHGHVSGPAIHLIEHGKVRPSMPTLQLIAARTGKPLDFFIAKTPWNQYAATLGLELPVEVLS